MRDLLRIKSVFTTRGLAVIAMLVAMSAALAPLVIWITPQQKLLSFTLLPLAVGSVLFGPWAAVLMGAASDTLNYLIRPMGPYFPGYALSLAVSCLFYAFWQYKRPIRLWRIACAQLCTVVFVHFGLNMLWQAILLGGTAAGFTAAGFYSAVRLINNAVTFPFMAGSVYALAKVASAIGNRRPESPDTAAARADVLGVGFDGFTIGQAAERALELLRVPGGHYIVTPNSEMLVAVRNDKQALRALLEADMVLPDGIGVVIASRMLKRPVPNRVAGIDFAQALFSRCEGKRIFLLGAAEGVAERAMERLGSMYPGPVFCGCLNGYFTGDAPVIETIRAAKPDILLVCLGAVKQEKWMLEHKDAFGDCLMAGLGGSLDIWSGDLKRAPAVFVRLGLEWFYRLLRQPSRIGRMTRLPYFLYLVCGQRRAERGAGRGGARA